MRKTISFLLLVLLAAAPALAAPRPDPTVTLELAQPAAMDRFLPGQTIPIAARVGDPDHLVRRVFIRVTDAGGAPQNADQDAVFRGGAWALNLELPSDARPGIYTIHVAVLGEGDTPLQWTQRPVEVRPAKFALTVDEPAPGAVFARNASFDVVARLDDPRHQARRVFVLFDDPKRHALLNGDEDATRRGDLWIETVHVPATLLPGLYRIVVKAVGVGMEPLGERAIPVMVALAPVSLGPVQIDPKSRILPGMTVKTAAALNDPNHVVRRVVVTCLNPDGKPLLSAVPAALRNGAWTRDIDLDEDQPHGPYQVQFQALAQDGEVLGTSRSTFVVLKQP